MKKQFSRQQLFRATLAAAVATGTIVAVAPLESEASKLAMSDITNNQHKEAIKNLLERGIVKGFPDGTFKPGQQVTRGQAAKIIAQILNLDTQNVKDPGLMDVSKESQYYGAIAVLVNKGIISGYEDKTFKPGNPLTRAQMAKILAVGFGFKEEPFRETRLVDVKSTNWYAGYVQALLTHQITSGTSATTFSPGEYVTRGQLASFVIRCEKEALGKNEVPSQPNEELPKNEETKPELEPNENKDTTGQPNQPGGKDNQNGSSQPDKDAGQNGSNPSDGKTDQNSGSKPGTPGDNGSAKPNGNEGTSSNEPSKDKDAKLTQAEIEQKYAALLDDIQNSASSSLDSLVDSAINEYNELKRKGGEIKISSLYNSYSSAANNLEASTDAAMNSVLQSMAADLISNGYSTESVKSISDSYNASKKSIKDSLLSGILGNL
ncbi:S-layer homology domain-containing protein [Sporosarcina sp. SAFN-015]|uniref:S-layer homology domain-containing protein n=1 Tax=Sporosarcina sp. SAFN-015 TaxID=3387274 RepID=UPI003F816386